MAKHQVRTKITIDGYRDISKHVIDAILPRTPGEAEVVHLIMVVDRLEVENDGTLVIHVDTEE